MASKTKYPTHATQTSGGNFVQWSPLQNIMVNQREVYAHSNREIMGKDEPFNRPSTITVNRFDFNLPLGAEPTRVIIEFGHKKNKVNDRTCNIQAPLVSLTGVNSSFSKKAHAPALDWGNINTVTFNVKGKLTRNMVNSYDFGCIINYPKNSNDFAGFLSFSYVRMTVEYNVSNYTIKAAGESNTYNEGYYYLDCSISNISNTSYKNKCTLSLPNGFDYESMTGDGTITVHGRSLEWNPNLNQNTRTRSARLKFRVNVTLPTPDSTYDAVFQMTENLNGKTVSRNVKVIPVPPDKKETDPSDSDAGMNEDDTSPVPINWEIIRKNQQYYVTGKEEDYVLFVFPCLRDGSERFVGADTPVHAVLSDSTDVIATNYDGNDYTGLLMQTYSDLYLYGLVPGLYVVRLFKNNGDDLHYQTYRETTPDYSSFFEIIPDELEIGQPVFSIYKPNDDELERIAAPTIYTVQSYIQHVTDDSYERDWYNNNRIGVFNNAIDANVTVDEETGTITDNTDYDNLSEREIYENVKYWSNNLVNTNVFESIECNFVYNDEYPLYIILTQDHTNVNAYDFERGQIIFTEPVLIEQDVYTGREHTGQHFSPVKSIISGDGTSATLELKNKNSPFVLFDYEQPVGVIRGLEITGHIDVNDDVMLSADIKTSKGTVSTRTLLITPDVETFNLGGLGDIWGFENEEFTDISEFEAVITLTTFNFDDVIGCNISDCTLIAYVENVIKSENDVIIDGEALSDYGVFVDDSDVPMGLETDTNIVSYDGSDLNDASIQNIRPKIITLQMNLGECDYKVSTLMLNQLTRLFVNDRDEYNKPIPKTLEFTFNPGLVYEYIMLKPFEVETEAGDYNVTAELTIPDGTAYSATEKVTGSIGYVQGLAKVKPVLVCNINSDSEELTLTESYTGQSFHMLLPRDEKIIQVYIDCENRTVYGRSDNVDDEPTDLSAYVDYNVDWFRIKDDYTFNSMGGSIHLVKYRERW